MMNKDLRDILLALNAHHVEYLVVGAYAVGVHSEPRATKDLDILIRTSERNSEAVFKAWRRFAKQLCWTRSRPRNRKLKDSPNSARKPPVPRSR